MPAPQRSTEGLRIGVFGGAFDPPHCAHRALAQAALSELRLDRLHVLPTGRAWHKARPLTDFTHRIAMCERVFGDLAGVHLDARDVRREAPTHTVHTLEELAREHPQAALFLVIGDDQLAAFTGWKRWQDVLRLTRLVVAIRPVASVSAEAPQPATDPAVDQVVSGHHIPFIRLNAPLLDISATAVRAMLGAGNPDPQALAELVPEAVASYISQHSLYQKPS